MVALRDLHANPFRITARAISNRMKQDLALRALNMAIAIRRPPPGCIHHTDRPSHGLQANRCRAKGSQYCAHDYQKLLRTHGFKGSMSRKGTCYDRAILRHWFKNNGEVRRRKLLQVAPLSNCCAIDCRTMEGRTGLAPQLTNPPRGRGRALRIHQRLLQPAPETLSPQLEITRGLRTESRIT